MLRTLAFAVFFLPFVGCERPCQTLRDYVCNDPIAYRHHVKECKLLNESERFKSLTPESCESMLKHLRTADKR